MSTPDLKAHKKNPDTKRNFQKERVRNCRCTSAGGRRCIFYLFLLIMSLNLKSIDFGYELQELTSKKSKLNEEIDKLKSEKARLLNLKRVEQLVMEETGVSVSRSRSIYQGIR